MKIENSTEPIACEIKRFYPPFRITDTCPTCGEDVKGVDDGEYLSYPTFNKPFEVYFYCGACEENAAISISTEGFEWTKEIIIHCTAKEVT